MQSRDIATAKTSELVAFFNAHTGGAQVKKFADRKTAERRVAALIIEMEAELNPTTAALVAEESDKYSDRAFTHCPLCSISLSNGLQTYDNLSAEKDPIAHTMTHELMCLGCGGFFGPEVKRVARKTPSAAAAPATTRPAMAESLKLDRRITHVETGQVYANACQVWKAGLVSASQGDRLSAVLYGAAKKGDYVELKVNGHTFTLAARNVE